MNRVRVLLFLALCTALAAAAGDSSGELTGRVIDALTGKTIVRAHVFVTVGASDRIVLLTDDEGAFRVQHLPAGGIGVWAQRPGYLGDPFDPPAPESRAQITIPAATDGPANPATVTLKLTPEAVIAGKALDEKGAGYARVELWARDLNGKVVFQGEQNTDRTGEFRFAPLSAGRYYLAVSSLSSNASSPGSTVYVERFYKEGASLQTATPIDVTPGQVESVAMLLQSAQGHKVRGRVECADPRPSAVSMNLEGDQNSFGITFWDAQTRAFTFTNIPPGAYVLQGGCNNGGNNERLWTQITVGDSDLDGIVLSHADR